MADEKTPGAENEELDEQDLEKLAEELADEDIKDVSGGFIASPELGEAGSILGEAG